MLNKFYKVSVLGIIVSIVPFISYAQLGETKNILTSAKGIVTDILIPLAFTLALLFFFWGIAKYIWSVGSDGKEEGKKVMLWGVVALFVMASIWGIVYFIDSEFELGSKDVKMSIPGFAS